MKYLIALALLLCLAVPSLAASTLFMRIDTLKGSYNGDRTHKDWCELVSMKGPNKSGESGPIVVRKVQDEASSALMGAATAGAAYPTIIIDLCTSSSAPDGQTVVQKFTLGKAVIREANVVYEKLAEGTRPVEEITISYDTINWEASTVRPDGAAGPGTKDSWNNGTKAKT